VSFRFKARVRAQQTVAETSEMVSLKDGERVMSQAARSPRGQVLVKAQRAHTHNGMQILADGSLPDVLPIRRDPITADGLLS
jgi:hypothetical protein